MRMKMQKLPGVLLTLPCQADLVKEFRRDFEETFETELKSSAPKSSLKLISYKHDGQIEQYNAWTEDSALIDRINQFSKAFAARHNIEYVYDLS